MRGRRLRIYAGGMKKIFRIVPLPTEVANRARRMAASGRTDHQILVVDSPQAYPCRHCLRWAAPGEKLILFPYQSIPADRPYGESGPIFVHQAACDQYSATDAYPPDFREGRAIRGYNSMHDMIAAAVADQDPEAVMVRMLANPAVAFLQVRSVTRGCFTMKVERA